MPLERRSVLKIRMGRCRREGKKVVPEARAGDLELLEVPGVVGVSVEWRERGAAKPELELLVLPSETRFRCINKGVFLLEYVASADRKYFFWAQETEGALSDEDCVTKISQALNPSKLSGSQEDSSSASILSYVSPTAPTISYGAPAQIPATPAAVSAPLPAVKPAAISAPVPPAAAEPAPGGALQIADLQSILSSLGAGGGAVGDREAMRAADLQLLCDVLSFEALFPLITADPEGFEQRLMQYMPAELQQPGEVYNVLRSPQFRQALESFHSALLSGHLQMSLFRELNLDLNAIGARPTSEAFLRAIRAAPAKSEEKPPEKMDSS